MKRGCCLGGIAVLVLGLVLVYAVGYYIGNMGLLLAAPRADTAAAAPGRPALLVRFDTRGAEAFRLFQEGTRGLPGPVVSAVLPYEASLGVTLEPETERLQVTWAVSMRRLAGVLAQRAHPDDWRPLATLEQPTLAREAEGLLVSHSYYTLPAEFAQPAPAAPLERLALSGVHNLEVLMDNRDGAAFLALQPWLRAPERPTAQLRPPVEAPERDVLLRGALAQLHVVRLVGDATSFDTFELELRASATDAQAAEGALLYLLMLRDRLFQELLQEGILLDGELVREDAELVGSFTLTGHSELLVQHLRGALS